MVQKVTLVYLGLLFVTQYKAKTERFDLALRSHRQINFHAGVTKITKASVMHNTFLHLCFDFAQQPGCRSRFGMTVFVKYSPYGGLI